MGFLLRFWNLYEIGNYKLDVILYKVYLRKEDIVLYYVIICIKIVKEM